MQAHTTASPARARSSRTSGRDQNGNRQSPVSHSNSSSNSTQAAVSTVSVDVPDAAYSATLAASSE